MAALVLICVVLLLVARKRNTYRMRSGTDTSMLSHLTAAAAKSEEEEGSIFSDEEKSRSAIKILEPMPEITLVDIDI